MSTPDVNISVSPAQRTGTFKTATLDYPGGYELLSWQLTGLGSGPGSDYENPANGFTATVFSSTDGGNTFTVYDQATWNGGPFTHNGVTDPPPTLAIGLGGLPVGKVFIEIDLVGTMTIGLSGLLTANP